MHGKIISSSRADTQIIPCLLTCFSIPISALIMLIIFSFHPCNRLTVTVVQLPAWFFQTSHFPPTECLLFSLLSPFSLITILPIPPFIYQVIFPLLLFSEMCLSDLYVSPVNCSPSPSPIFDWLVPPLMFINLVLLFPTFLTL